jgi:hypothetical protein
VWEISPGIPAAHRFGSPKPSQQQSHYTELLEAHVGNQAAGLLLPEDMIPLCFQCYCPTLLDPTPGKQAPELLLSKGLVPLSFQQLTWLWVTQHQQANLRAHDICRYVSPMPSATAMAPGSSCSNTGRPQGFLCLVGTRQFKPASSAAPQNPQLAIQCQHPATTHPSEPQAPGFAIFWHQKASLPTEHRCPALPTVPDSKRALTPPPKSKNTRFPTEGRKVITCHTAGGTRSPVPTKHTEAQHFTPSPCRRVTSFLSKSWNPSSSTE